MMRHFATSVLAATVLVLSSATTQAQTYQISLSSSVASSGAAVLVSFNGPPGQPFALVGSSTNAGFQFAGVAFDVGLDVTLLAVGTLDTGGAAQVSVVAPFRGTTLDRYYLQAAFSPTPSFSTVTVSNGAVIRNGDLVGGLTGPAGPAGPTGPAGAAGATGPAGPQGESGLQGSQGALGPAGPAGSQGPPGPQGIPGVSASTDGLGRIAYGQSLPAGVILDSAFLTVASITINTPGAPAASLFVKIDGSLVARHELGTIGCPCRIPFRLVRVGTAEQSIEFTQNVSMQAQLAEASGSVTWALQVPTGAQVTFALQAAQPNWTNGVVVRAHGTVTAVTAPFGG